MTNDQTRALSIAVDRLMADAHAELLLESVPDERNTMSNPELAEWKKHSSDNWVLSLAEGHDYSVDAVVFVEYNMSDERWDVSGGGQYETLPSAKRAAEVALRRELENALARLGDRGEEQTQ